MTVESVKVPQHLELEDVVAWGLGVVDLLCLVAGAATAWWLYLVIPGEPALRLVPAGAAALIGMSLGIVRIGELSLRRWLVIACAYARRPRVLVTGG